MISGDLIRMKNLVDDALRTVRQIQREAERLQPDEYDRLVEHIQSNAEALREILPARIITPK